MSTLGMIRFTALALLLQCLAAHASYHYPDPKITITLPGAPPIQYSYNEAGLRDSQSQNGNQINYIYDQTSLIAETNTTGNELARSSYYSVGHSSVGTSVGLIAEARSGVQTYLHTDALSTPIAVTDTSSAVTTRYTWDTWGNLQQQTGSSQQPFGFTGYQRDEQTGLHYAQQRYYDSEIGRFNRHDPFRGDIDNPLSLHRYLYANANPTIYVDPDGRMTSFDIRFEQRAQALLSGEISDQEFIEQNAAEAKGAIVGASLLAGGVVAGLGARAGIAAISSTITEIRSVGLLNAILGNTATVNTIATEASITAAAVTTGAEIPINAPVTAAKQITTKIAQVTQKAKETAKSAALLVSESKSGISNVFKGSVAKIEDQLVRKTFEPDVRFGSFDDLSEFGGDLFADVTRGGAGPVRIGQRGEELAGITGPKARIPSATGTANFRVPDELTPTTLREVKNVRRLQTGGRAGNQLRDFSEFGRQTGRQCVLCVRQGTQISPQSQQVLDDLGFIVRKELP